MSHLKQKPRKAPALTGRRMYSHVPKNLEIIDQMTWYLGNERELILSSELKRSPGGGGCTPIHYLYGYVPPNGVVILKLLI